MLLHLERREMKKSKLPQQGVWQKNWSSFLSERAIPESEKYLVLATWNVGDQEHSCRYPVRATSRDDAVRFVEAYDRSKDRPLFTGTNNLSFEVLLVERVEKSQLEDLVRMDPSTVVN
jgi:hypothetical protein